MDASQILREAGCQLVSIREEIIRACGPNGEAITELPWPNQCFEAMQLGTIFHDDGAIPNCEIGFRAVHNHASDNSFSTRMLGGEAERLASDNSVDPPSKPGRLVDFYLRNLPRPKPHKTASDEPGGAWPHVLHHLGVYFPESGVLGGRVDIYWARIAQYSALHPQLPRDDLAKVVMLHQLAHYLTHQGVTGFSDSEWRPFPSGRPVVEVVAQVATEDALEQLGNGLMTTFEALLQGQPAEYTEHRKIRQRLKDVFPESEENDKTEFLWNFWGFFGKHIKPNHDEKFMTLSGIYALIDKVRRDAGP